MRRALLLIMGVAVSLLATPGHAQSQIETSTVCWTNYNPVGGNWDWSDSIPFGTVPRESDFSAAGLKLDLSLERQTSPTNQGKSSAYVALGVDVKLSTVNNVDALLSYDGTPTPGYQLRAHALGDAVWNGHLVRENGSDKWWATRPQDWPLVVTASAMSGGATLADYKAAYPLATVSHVGYSLGSGVTTVGLIKSLTFQGSHWVFGLCPSATTSPTTTVDTSVTLTTTAPVDTSTTTTPRADDVTTTTTAPVSSDATSLTPTSDVVIVDRANGTLPDTGTDGNTLGVLMGIGLLMVLVGGLSFAVTKLRRMS